jgi:hypothetical protein
LSEQIEPAKNVLTRIEVKSPEAGIVADLKFHTPGVSCSRAIGSCTWCRRRTG